MEVERSALGGEQVKDRRGTLNTHKTQLRVIDSLRRDLQLARSPLIAPSFYHGPSGTGTGSFHTKKKERKTQSGRSFLILGYSALSPPTRYIYARKDVILGRFSYKPDDKKLTMADLARGFDALRPGISMHEGGSCIGKLVPKVLNESIHTIL